MQKVGLAGSIRQTSGTEFLEQTVHLLLIENPSVMVNRYRTNHDKVLEDS